MKSILLLFTIGAMAAGSYAFQKPAGSCCDQEGRGCSPTGTCTACKNCNNCAHCKGGGTCSVCKKKETK